MKTVLTFFSFLLLCTLTAQTTADFESFELNPGEFLNGSDLSGGFNDADIFLPNFFNPEFASWTGWAISATTDNTTPGFTNQYSSITGGGFEGSSSYAVRYDFVPSIMHLTGESAGAAVSGMYITNSTYAFLSMRDGDAYAKRFGGESGEDPDYFLLTIKGFTGGFATEDSVDFYLADYRAENPIDDYIVDEWTWVDLTSLGDVDSLWFNLTSTDIGQFGMNTPAYFCIDHVMTNDNSTSTSEQPIVQQIDVFPNPATNNLSVVAPDGIDFSDVIIYTMSGQNVASYRETNSSASMDISSLEVGMYIVSLVSEKGQYVSRFSKITH